MSVPGPLSASIPSRPDGPCLLSPTGRFLFRLSRKILAIAFEMHSEFRGIFVEIGLFLWKCALTPHLLLDTEEGDVRGSLRGAAAAKARRGGLRPKAKLRRV